MLDERAGGDDLLERLAAIAIELADAATVEETLQLIVDRGQDLLAGCDGVSMMLIGRGGRIETPAFSSDVARDSDLAQYATGEGPCLDAIEHHRTIVLNDLETDERWPDYRARALELGVRSMISFRLFVTDDSLGALDLYSTQVNAFDERSQLVGQAFAAQASVALRAAMTEAGLQTALRSRDVIGQAKGIVMARYRITSDMAFDTLKRLSQHRNQPLRDLAAEIAESGAVPPR